MAHTSGQTARTTPRANGNHTALYLAPDGKWLSAGTYSAKAVALVHAQNAYVASQKSDWIDPKGSKTVLGIYAESTWFPSIAGLEVKTLNAYDSTYRNHVLPAWGAREMGSILTTEVKTWLANMEKAGVGRSTQRKAYVILNMILKAALGDRLISSLATLGVKTKPVPKPKPLAFSPSNWEKFLVVVDGPWVDLYRVGMLTGMRSEELRALCPEQILWSRKTINIDRATPQGSEKANGSRFIDKDTKSHRPREIVVNDEVLRILAKLVKARGLLPTSTERIFVAADGRPFGQETVNDFMLAACAKAEIPPRTMKHLRSSKASWMLKETRDLVAVKEYLGHASITTTEQSYLAVEDDQSVDSDNVISFEDYLEEQA